ncbi:MAG: hypothetical protein AB3N15_00150 [Paracoccaceae bacterium]
MGAFRNRLRFPLLKGAGQSARSNRVQTPDKPDRSQDKWDQYTVELREYGAFGGTQVWYWPK